MTLAVRGTPLAVVTDTLYAADDAARLNAYSLRTGRQRWSVAVPATAEPDLIAAGSYALLISRQGGVTAVEAGTGAVRWHRPGSPVWVSPAGDRVVLTTEEPAAGPDLPHVSVFSVVTLPNGADSAVFRSDSTDPAAVFTPDAGDWPTGMFVRDDADGGRLFDFATASTRRFDLPRPAPPTSQRGTGDQLLFETLLLAGDVTVSTTQWGGRSTMTGYGGSPPRPRWSMVDVGLYTAGWCGAALCGWNGNEAIALDPTTGTVRWRFPGGRLWRASEHRLYASFPAGVDDSIGITVLDETTGRRFLRQDAWRPVELISGARLPIIAYVATGQVLAILDARRLITQRLILLPSGRPDCWASDTDVACRVGKDTFRAWAYST